MDSRPALEAIKVHIDDLWLQKRMPYMLFEPDQFYKIPGQDKFYTFTVPMKTLLLWQNFEHNSPLVAEDQCTIVQDFPEWRLSVARLYSVAMFLVVTKEFEGTNGKFTFVTKILLDNPIIMYNVGKLFAV